MYKIYPVKSLVFLTALITLFVFLAIELLTSAFGMEIRLLAIPGIVWLIMVAFTVNPIWRFFWKCSKKVSFLNLNKRVFPDLNGEWEMALESNWSRQEQILDAAFDQRQSFDMRTCGEDDLKPLWKMQLLAKIEQSWWSIKITVTNPNQDSPIRKSQTYIVNPRKKGEREPASLCYFYDQVNDTDNLADDPIFSAAACLSYDETNDCLEGTFWTARQWRRAINTAGRLTLKRKQ